MNIKEEIIAKHMMLSEKDLYLFAEGNHSRLYRVLGAQPIIIANQQQAVHFAVWAPNARQVFLIGDFNKWNKSSHPLISVADSGIWKIIVPDLATGGRYKYHIISNFGLIVDKADPLSFYNELSPATASIIWQDNYVWHDELWMKKRSLLSGQNQPMSIYELHFGSWRRVVEENNRPLTYREMAAELTAHIKNLGFTHVEFLPLMEHPFYGSWGYQTTGYFAPTSRYGSPADLKYLIDYLHQHDIGVIFDWVPSHFPTDAHGLAVFDGTHLYEHADPRLGFHPDWKSAIFNYDRHEVRSFLLSSACYWLENFHVDGLRVDAVASMLYLDYSRPEGEWIANCYGGRENLAAISFLRQLNECVYREFPDVQIIAEESTAWGLVSRPTSMGGLGFGYKWDMGWMHDTLDYLQKDPIHRSYHQNDLTFRMLYAFTENFILPLSHDEVVHGKGSLLAKMPGDDWQKFANLRLLLGYQYAQPGKKLLFMGGEFGQWQEWNHDQSLEWHLLHYAPHQGLQKWLNRLNTLYCQQPALYQLDTEANGFQWLDCLDHQQSILSFIRYSADNEIIVIVINATPMTHHDYRLGMPIAGDWHELANSDDSLYGGSGQLNQYLTTENIPAHNQPVSLILKLPPLGILFLQPNRNE